VVIVLCRIPIPSARRIPIAVLSQSLLFVEINRPRQYHPTGHFVLCLWATGHFVSTHATTRALIFSYSSQVEIKPTSLFRPSGGCVTMPQANLYFRR